MNVKTLLMLAVCMVVAACGGSTSSDNVTSEGIQAEITVEARGSGITHVDAVLTVGSGGAFGTDLDLSSSDTFSAHAYDETRVFNKNEDILGEIDYSTSFPFNEGPTEFRVSLERTNNPSMPNSTVTLPQGFVIVAPTQDQVFTTMDDIELTWDPSGYADTIYVDFWFECDAPANTKVVFTRSRTEADDGTATYPAADLLDGYEPDLDETGECDTNIEVMRSSNGTLDPGYGEGGYIRARQLRDVDVVIQF